MSLPWTKFDLQRAVYSDTYLALTPGIERLIAVALWLHASANGAIPDEDSYLSLAGHGMNPAEIRSVLPRAGFHLKDRRWVHPISSQYFEEANDFREGKAKAGRAGARARWQSQMALPDDGALRPSVPPSVPPSVRSSVRCSENYLLALQMRKGRVPREPAPGVLGDVEEKVRKRHDEGHEYELLAALPALQPDSTFKDGSSVLDRMFARPEALLGENEKRTGTHASRIRESLDGLVVSERQKTILEAIGSWEWCEAQGVKVKAKVVIR